MTTPKEITSAQVSRRVLLAAANGTIFFWLFSLMFEYLTHPPFTRTLMAGMAFLSIIPTVGMCFAYLSLIQEDEVRPSNIRCDTAEMIASFCVYGFILVIPLVSFAGAFMMPSPFAR